MQKVILIVLDSVGIGALPDAQIYGDQGTNTLEHIAAADADFALPNLTLLGLGHLEGLPSIPAVSDVSSHCYYGRMQEASAGKDTVTGHWEMTGIITTEPFPVFPQGFPKPVIQVVEAASGLKLLGNIPASGTEIIQRLGDEHVKSGQPIIYTSGDSVLQIAAHEAVIPLENLYRICAICRERLIAPPYNIGRVIARPFIGERGNYTRTANRHDFSLPPPKSNLLTDLQEQNMSVLAVGKINDIFAGVGITQAVHTTSNRDGINQLLQLYAQMNHGLLFANLVDFDSLYGHRRDPLGYGKALMDFDQRLPEMINMLDSETLLIITADHGCDPTAHGTDHTREYVPLLIYGKMLSHGRPLGTLQSFTNLGATIADYLQATYSGQGKSLTELLR